MNIKIVAARHHYVLVNYFSFVSTSRILRKILNCAEWRELLSCYNGELAERMRSNHYGQITVREAFCV